MLNENDLKDEIEMIQLLIKQFEAEHQPAKASIYSIYLHHLKMVNRYMKLL